MMTTSMLSRNAEKFYLEFKESYQATETSDPIFCNHVKMLADKKAQNLIDSFNRIVDGVFELVHVGYSTPAAAKSIIEGVATKLGIVP